MLDRLIFLLADALAPQLTVIDGVYSLERGPLHFGRARRRDLIIASRDVYNADLVGSHALGFTPLEVRHLADWAKEKKRTMNATELDLVFKNDIRDHARRKDGPPGKPDLEQARRPLPYDWEWSAVNNCPDLYDKLGIRGIILPKYDHTLCTGCSFLYIPLMVGLMAAPGREFEPVEFLTGKIMEPTGLAKKTFLLGRCQVAKNRKHEKCGEIVEINGCPPLAADLLAALEKHNLPVSAAVHNAYRRDTMKRYTDKPALFPAEHFFLAG